MQPHGNVAGTKTIKIMENKTEFEQYAAQVAEQQEHNAEIQRTRVGGLGGSDADMLMRVGRNGMAALTATDMKRLAVMMGMAAQEQWGGNVYTNAGHAFEDYAETRLPVGKNVRVAREEYIEQLIAKNFKTFAHADFTTRTGRQKKAFNVVECKYVQKDTDKVAQEYAAQLQWYYILGAQGVTLLHGRGAVDPFDPDMVEATAVNIERNDDICRDIMAGVKALDTAISDGWKPITPEKQHVGETSQTVQRAFETLQRCKVQREALDAEETAAKAVIASYMEDFACSSIFADNGDAVTMTKASTSRTFDGAKLLKAHPEFDTDEFYKTVNRKASISFKAAKVAEK